MESKITVSGNRGKENIYKDYERRLRGRIETRFRTWHGVTWTLLRGEKGPRLMAFFACLLSSDHHAKSLARSSYEAAVGKVCVEVRDVGGEGYGRVYATGVSFMWPLVGEAPPASFCGGMYRHAALWQRGGGPTEAAPMNPGELGTLVLAKRRHGDDGIMNFSTVLP
jgi:hypothetical protein